MKKPKNTKRIFLLLLFIVLIGFFVRVWNVDKNPAGFFADEASIGYNAYSILKTGKDEWGFSSPLLFKAFGQYADPVMIYSAIPIIKIFGLSEFSVRLTSVLYGSLSIIAVFLLAKQLFGKNVALISALFLAISPWHIHFSRIGFELISSTFWVPFSLFLFLKSIKKFKTYYLLTIISFFISFFTYYPVKIYLPILFLSLFIIYYKETKHWFKERRFWLINITALSFLILLMLPYLRNNLFLARWNDVKSNTLTLPYLIKGYFNHFSLDFLFKKGDIDFDGQFISRHSVRGMGELYLFQLPLITLALISFIKKRKHEMILLFIFLLIYPIGTIFTDIKPQATRSIIGVIPFQIISAYGLFLFYSFLNNKKSKIIFNLITIIVIFISFYSYANLYKSYSNYSSNYWGWQFGPKEIISYFKIQTKNYDELYMTGSFNAPEIFLKFYDPERKCQNCFIGGADKYDSAKKQLFAIRTEELKDFKAKNKIKKIIYYPNGQEAFYIL